MVALLDAPMPRAKRNDETVKVDAEILKMARYVVLERETTLAEYLSAALRPIVEKDYKAAIAKLTKGAK